MREMHQREKILNTYGFDVLDVDDNGELIYRQQKVQLQLSLIYIQEEKDQLESVNENKMRVKLPEKAKLSN